MGLDLTSNIEVDHKDRNKLNNSIDNLQLLAKDQHVLKTIEERGLTVRNTKYCSCGSEKTFGQTLCAKCVVKPTTKLGTTVEAIESWVTNSSWVRASKELGLSDNGLRKRYRTLTGKDPKRLTKHNYRVNAPVV